MKPLLLIGPVCKDINQYEDNKQYEGIGGAVYYQSKILEKLKIPYQMEITIAEKDQNLIKNFPKEKTHTIFKKETISFKNIYTKNKRIQYSNFANNPIQIKDLKLNKQYSAIVINPLLKTDIPLKTIQTLKKLKTPIFLSIQGLIRNKTKTNQIKLEYNPQINEIIENTNTIFLDKTEAKILTKTKTLTESINKLKKQNIKEIVITLAENGSIIYNKELDKLIQIPPQKINKIKYLTGAGDTYMISYILKRLEGENIKKSGEYASKLTGQKIEGTIYF